MVSRLPLTRRPRQTTFFSEVQGEAQQTAVAGLWFRAVSAAFREQPAARKAHSACDACESDGASCEVATQQNLPLCCRHWCCGPAPDPWWDRGTERLEAVSAWRLMPRTSMQGCGAGAARARGSTQKRRSCPALPVPPMEMGAISVQRQWQKVVGLLLLLLRCRLPWKYSAMTLPGTSERPPPAL